MFSRLKEIRERAREQGWPTVFALIKQHLRNRVTNPWMRVYWLALDQWVSRPLPEGTTFSIVNDRIRDLTAEKNAAVAKALGRSNTVADHRLAQGATLNVLFLGDEVAGWIFSVPGTARAFQHVVITPRDAVLFDARVAPAFRRRGYFEAMLAQLADHFRAQGRERFYADALETNLGSCRGMERLGWQYLTRYRKSSRGAYYFGEVPL